MPQHEPVEERKLHVRQHGGKLKPCAVARPVHPVCILGKDTAWERGMRAATGVLEDYDAFHCTQESSDSDDV